MSEQSNMSRRTILSGAVAGFALTASGLFLPEVAEDAAAREGALGGAKGGRRGKDHRGHDKHKRRDHGEKKEQGNDRPPQGAIYRDVALFVHNLRNVPVEVQGWQIRGSGTGNPYIQPDSSWEWSTIEAKPATGMEHFKDFWGTNWEVAVRINTDRVVHAYNRLFKDPGGYIYTGGWDGKNGWNPKGVVLAKEEYMQIDVSIQAPGIRLQRTTDSATHLQFYVWLT